MRKTLCLIFFSLLCSLTCRAERYDSLRLIFARSPGATPDAHLKTVLDNSSVFSDIVKNTLKNIIKPSDGVYLNSETVFCVVRDHGYRPTSNRPKVLCAEFYFVKSEDGKNNYFIHLSFWDRSKNWIHVNTDFINLSDLGTAKEKFEKYLTKIFVTQLNDFGNSNELKPKSELYVNPSLRSCDKLKNEYQDFVGESPGMLVRSLYGTKKCRESYYINMKSSSLLILNPHFEINLEIRSSNCSAESASFVVSVYSKDANEVDRRKTLDLPEACKFGQMTLDQSEGMKKLCDPIHVYCSQIKLNN